MALAVTNSYETVIETNGFEVFDGPDMDWHKRRTAFERQHKIKALTDFVDNQGGDIFYVGKSTVTHPRPADLFPKKLRFRNKSGKRLWDCLYAPGVGGFVVSQAMKDLIENIEPNVHQFHPVEVFLKNGEPTGGPRYFWNLTEVIDAIRFDEPWHRGLRPVGVNQKLGEGDWFTQDVEGVTDQREMRAVDAKKIAGRAAWYDIRHAQWIFISDVLFQAMEAQGLTHAWRVTSEWAEV